MNLISDQWMRVKCKDGAEDVIAPYQLTEFSGDKTIVDVVAPRADLKGALYQFLIGLVQTCFVPRDEDEWEEYWLEPPTPEIFQEAFEKYKNAFELENFVQDYDLSEGERKSISALYIEAPGGKTTRDNLDHFIKGGTVNHVDAYWAALSLFTLQINAPAGGVGHRVSLRGGGPLTTLVMPPESAEKNTLWHCIWLNVLTQEEIEPLIVNHERNKEADIFPWLAPTRTSENKDGETPPEHAHPYQMYWCMPRRIRLDVENATSGICDITGQQSDHLLSHFITKNYGVNYSGNWRHPLTPYNVDPQKGAFSIKAQPGGITYRHWLGLVLDDASNHKQVAKVVDVYDRVRREIIGGDFVPRLWVFGYDMDNMKARCWYEASLPLFNVPEAKRDDTHELSEVMVEAVVEVIGNVRNAVKSVWFIRPKDAKGDLSFVDVEFWMQTEARFYQLLEKVLSAGCDEVVMVDIKQQWRIYLYGKALSLFDYWALSAGNEDGDMKRSVKARTDLEKWLRVGKKIKKLAA